MFANIPVRHNAHAHTYRVIKVAKEFSGRVNFAVSDKVSFRGELDALGLDASADVVVGMYDSKGKYAMTEKFRWVLAHFLSERRFTLGVYNHCGIHSVDSFKAFVQKYLDGDVELYVKSEDVPEDNDGPVKVRRCNDSMLFCLVNVSGSARRRACTRLIRVCYSTLYFRLTHIPKWRTPIMLPKNLTSQLKLYLAA